MAYHDADGKITIDEVAANRDISHAMQAKQSLAEAESKLKLKLNQTASFEGETAQALNEKSAQLLARVKSMMTEIDEMVAYTRRVVAHYRAIDESN